MQGIRTDAFNSMRTTKLTPQIALESLTDRVKVSSEGCVWKGALKVPRNRFQATVSALSVR